MCGYGFLSQTRFLSNCAHKRRLWVCTLNKAYEKEDHYVEVKTSMCCTILRANVNEVIGVKQTAFGLDRDYSCQTLRRDQKFKS